MGYGERIERIPPEIEPLPPEPEDETLGNTLEGYNAFYRIEDESISCPLEILIPNDITMIASRALEDNGLRRVVIPDGVTSIGSDVFRGNPLTSVCIEGSRRSFHEDAFPSTVIPTFQTSCP